MIDDIPFIFQVNFDSIANPQHNVLDFTRCAIFSIVCHGKINILTNYQNCSQYFVDGDEIYATCDIDKETDPCYLLKV